MHGGFILISRRWDSGSIAHCAPCTRELFFYFLRRANFKDKNDLLRGELVTCYDEIIDGLSWKVGFSKRRYTRHQIEASIKALREHAMITTRKTRLGLIVSICNYSTYQTIERHEDHMEDHMKTTHSIEERKKERVYKSVKNKGDIHKYNGSIKEIIDDLNYRAGTKYKHTSKATIKFINRLLDTGEYTVDDFIKVNRIKVAEWYGTKHAQYIRPSTLYGNGKFDEYLNQPEPCRLCDGKGEYTQRGTHGTSVVTCECRR